MMDEERKEAVERLLKEKTCAKGCKCYHVDFDNLCKAESFGIESLLVCLEEEPVNCKFVFPFGGTNFCKCSLRQEIAKLVCDDIK